MKNFILILGLFLSFIAPSHGQMTLANTYPGNVFNQIQVINLSISGKKLATISFYNTSASDKIFYYDMNYSFWKMIPCPDIPGYSGFFSFFPYYLSGGPGIFVSYSSETLFNLDTLLEVAVPYVRDSGGTNSVGKLMIINENGVLVDSILDISTLWPFTVHSISSSSFIATVQTTSGPKVYNLPGTLPCDICGGGLGLAKTEEKPTNLLSSPIPNPSSNQVKITFSLPDGANRGGLTIYNTEGQKMKSYTVDNRFGFIMVDDSQFAPGIYYYNLTVNGTISSSQKMLVIK